MRQLIFILSLLLIFSLFVSNEVFLSVGGNALTLIDTSHAFTSSHQKIINFLNNSYYSNLLDPLSLMLEQSAHAFSVIILLISLTLIAFLRRSNEKWISGVIFLISLFLIFGIDSFILPLVAYCSLITVLLNHENKVAKTISVLLFAFVAIKLPAFSLLLYFLLFIGGYENRRDTISITCFLIACTFQFLVEPLRLEAYPDFSRVIKEITPFADSWIGESLPFLIATEKRFIELAIFPVIVLFLLALNELRIQKSSRLKISCGLLSILILEIVCIEVLNDTSISLLQTLVRLIPHGTVYAVGGFIFAYSMLCFFLEARHFKGVIYVAFLVAFLFAVKTPILLSPLKDFKNLKSISDVYSRSPIYESPSLRVLIDEGEEVMLAPLRMVLRSRSLDRFPFHIQAFARPELLERINSQELSKRWASLTSHQSGNEWIQISFTEPQDLKGLTLYPGEFQTDYPRGLKIESGTKSCDSLVKVYENNPYEGSILRTAEGFPYRTTPSLGEVLFDRTLRTSCLKISQVGTTNDYDWSISVIRLLQ